MLKEHYELLRKINELVIEAAHNGISEELIISSVDDGLNLVLGEATEDDEEEIECDLTLMNRDI